MDTQVYQLRQDDSTHWFLVPMQEIEEFDSLSRKIREVGERSDKFEPLVRTFDTLYRQFMISNPYDLKISTHE